MVEFSNELLGALHIMDRAPFVFFNTIALPAYSHGPLLESPITILAKVGLTACFHKNELAVI